MFLSRKINPAKWNRTEGLQPGETPADAVTNDLVTKSNTLSFWRCESASKDDESVKAVALALATGPRVQRFELIRLAFIPVADLEADGQNLEEDPGETAAPTLVALHVNVARLDALRLARLANSVAAAVRNRTCCRFTKSDVRNLVIGAYQNNTLDMSQLDPRLVQEIQQALSDPTRH